MGFRILKLKEVTNMCIIAYASERCLTEEEFKHCHKWNYDGVGFAWRKAGANYYAKGFMELEEAMTFYNGIKTIFPHAVHFRKASSGGVKSELTHPFIVDKNSPLSLKYKGVKQLLFHNGTIYNWENLFLTHAMSIKHLPEGALSDTRVAAMITSQLGSKALGVLGGKYIYWHGIGEKSKDILFGKWEEEKGIHFSNDDYKENRYAYTGYGYEYHNGSFKKDDKKNEDKNATTSNVISIGEKAEAEDDISDLFLSEPACGPDLNFPCNCKQGEWVWDAVHECYMCIMCGITQ
jgi:hypothetical protein